MWRAGFSATSRECRVSPTPTSGTCGWRTTAFSSSRRRPGRSRSCTRAGRSGRIYFPSRSLVVTASWRSPGWAAATARSAWPTIAWAPIWGRPRRPCGNTRWPTRPGRPSSPSSPRTSGSGVSPRPGLATPGQRCGSSSASTRGQSMIITRSPLRISLGGGGTDLPSYYRKHSGFLIAAAIDKYVYITLHQTFVEDLIIKYSKMERVSHADAVQHPIIREALRLVGIPGPYLELTSMADIPAGTGLGSSGSFTTALLKALHVYKKNLVHHHELAEQACHIEIELLREP